MFQGPPPAIPEHLRGFVVRQDYGEYTAEDQAVWRFVVLQTHAHLLETAHESYGSGFDAVGISVDRIPRVAEMSERLRAFGLDAVCVDGFIPPRAFQAFQARGLLPIAADIRTSSHLTYTPAPDIIHEAAGHAPLLVEPDFARYVRRIGEVAERAFATPADRDVYEAIHLLSELKEDPETTPSQLDCAEQALLAAKGRVSLVSEAARIARLYWWTAEYGLVGKLSDFRLYGAGLLSSIGEGHFCRRPSVRKAPLTARCVEVDYDITRAQPQLFVVSHFSELEGVLEEVASGLAQRTGGLSALSVAKESAEVATLELSSGAEAIGVVSRVQVECGAPWLVELEGACRLSLRGRVIEDFPQVARLVVPVGGRADGAPCSRLSPEELRKSVDARGELDLPFASGLRVRGRAGPLVTWDGRVVAVLLAGATFTRGGETLFSTGAPYPLAFGDAVTAVRAGAPAGYYAPTEFSGLRVPKPRVRDAAGRELVLLYERAIDAWRELAGSAVVREFDAIGRRLEEAFPDDWLLRWNMLESLAKMGESGEPGPRLEAELERLEIRFDRLEPIATGLGYVRSLVRSSANASRTVRKVGA